MGNVFPWVDQVGLPLDVIVDRLRDRDMMVDWINFFQDALQAGWKPERVFSKLDSVVRDVYGPDWANAWRKGMRAWMTLNAGVASG